jgi:hemoglobin/transferrin/lactoferrin receptor protein
MDFQNFQSTADVLSNSGSLFVQKSQQGGGVPSFSFEASRVLLLVDGVRMNNLIFRAGHLQNVITVDEFT